MEKADPEKRIQRGRSGFTLMEMTVTLAIIAIAAAVAIPAFAVWLPNYRLKSGTRKVVAAMNLARMTAIKENCDTVIWFTAGTGSSGIYHAFVDNGDGSGVQGNGTQDGTERTIIEGSVPDGVNLYSTVFSVLSNQTSFNNRGLAQGGWGYVYLKNDNSRYQRITLWTTGNLQIQDSKDGSTWS